MAAVNRIPFTTYFALDYKIDRQWSVGGDKGYFDDPAGRARLDGHWGDGGAVDFVYRDPGFILTGARPRPEIFAARAGYVVDLQRSWTSGGQGCGNYVVVRHIDGTVFIYCHLASVDNGVQVGQFVLQGRQLGIVGNTGGEFARHLHLEAQTSLGVLAIGQGKPGWNVGAQRITHFEDYYHAQPWRPVLGQHLTTNPQYARMDGWRRCYKCSGMYLQAPYQFGYQHSAQVGACPAGGGHRNYEWQIYTLPAETYSHIKAGFQEQGWYFCKKCRGLFKGTTGTVCPVSGSHARGTSWPGNINFKLLKNVGSGWGEGNWRFCGYCKGLWHWKGGAPQDSVCPATNGSHLVSVDNYTIHASVEDTQQRWRHCEKCGALFHSPYGTSRGVCPAGQAHSPGPVLLWSKPKLGWASKSGLVKNYYLCVNVSPINAAGKQQPSHPPSINGWQSDWRYCSYCGVLFYGPNQEQSVCASPDSAVHYAGSARRFWVLAWHPATFLVSRDNKNPPFNLRMLPPGTFFSNDGKQNRSESGWAWCSLCQGLFLNTGASRCPARTDGGAHQRGSATNYVVFFDQAPLIGISI